MRLLLVLLVLTVAAPLAGAQQAPQARCFADTSRWAYDRANETLAAPGERFLEDLSKCDPTFAASIVEATRYQIHDEETKKFVRANGFVMAAYGVAWGVLAISGLLLFLRQRKLNGEIATLEARIREAERP